MMIVMSRNFVSVKIFDFLCVCDGDHDFLGDVCDDDVCDDDDDDVCDDDRMMFLFGDDLRFSLMFVMVIMIMTFG